MVDVAVYFSDMSESAAYEKAAFAIEVLRLLEIGEDVIFFVYEGGVESAGP